MKIRVQAFQTQIHWGNFTIWGAGRDGKKFFNLLSEASKLKVIAFCDVDPKKIGKYYSYQLSPKECRRIPIVPWQTATPPIITCVALDRTNGDFERNVAALGLKPGEELLYFS